MDDDFLITDDDFLITAPFEMPFAPLTIMLVMFIGGFVALVLYSEYLRNRLRFSLRTLLIAMTFVAVALGLVVFLARR